MCCLSALNLSKFVVAPFSEEQGFDFNLFAKSIEVGVRFLDNVLTVTKYPIQDIEDQAMKYRRIGLGITGLGDAFAMLGMKYGSTESVEMTELIFETLRNVSYYSSALLAKEKGSFPEFDSRFMSGNFVSDLPQQVKDAISVHGIRNAYLNTVAPTGTTSLSLGNNCSGGIEPIFSLEYSRMYRTGKGDETDTEMVFDDAYLQFKEIYPEGDPSEYFSVVADLSVEAHVAVQAVAQKYVDQSISKTINLPSGTSLEEMKDVYMNAWKKGLKGCTVFHPDGKLMGILHTTPPAEGRIGIKITEAPERPVSLPCEIKEFTYQKQAYLALVGILDESPYEIFVIESKGEHYCKRRGAFSIFRTEGDTYQLHYDNEVFVDDISERFSFDDSAATVCLMTSGQLRYGVPIQSIVSQLSKKGLITSFPKAVARALKKFIPDEKPSVLNPCPSCGEPMRRSEGCFICDSCGYGKCG